MPVDAEALSQLVPMVAMLAVFGMPVAIVWTVLHFRLRYRELDAAVQARRELSRGSDQALEARAALLEARIGRIEAALLAQSGQPPAGRPLLAAERLDPAAGVPPPVSSGSARAELPQAAASPRDP